MVFDAMLFALCVVGEPGVVPQTQAPAAVRKTADAPLRTPPGAETGMPQPSIPEPPPPVSGRFKATDKKSRVTRVGVPEPNVHGKVSAREAAVLSQALVTEVRKLEGIGAIGVAEIREMLAQEYRRQMLGCSADSQCLAEIAGALGVDELVSSELVVDGDTSTFSVSRIDMRTTKVLANVQKRLARRKAGEEVLGAVGEVVAQLYKERLLRAGEQRGVAPEVARWLNPPPLPRWIFLATAGTAVAFGAGGALYGLQSNATRSDYNALVKGGPTVSGAELMRLKDQADDQGTRATVLLGVAGGLAVAAAVEAFFTDWHNDKAAVKVGPAGASVAVKF